MRFYEVIDTLDLNSDNYMATVCEGEYAGEKMIVTDGECKWQSSENGFFASHPDAFSVPTGCDLKAVDGVHGRPEDRKGSRSCDMRCRSCVHADNQHR